MLSDEHILTTIPVGPLGIIALDGCKELGNKVDFHISSWRKESENEHKHTIAFSGYQKQSYLVDIETPRFGSGEAKGNINQSVRGNDLYLMVDVTNYSLEYSVCGYKNHMSPAPHNLCLIW